MIGPAAAAYTLANFPQSRPTSADAGVGRTAGGLDSLSARNLRVTNGSRVKLLGSCQPFIR